MTVAALYVDPKGVDHVSWLNQPRGKGMSHGESSATPPAFRDVLLEMARSAAKPPLDERRAERPQPTRKEQGCATASTPH